MHSYSEKKAVLEPLVINSVCIGKRASFMRTPGSSEADAEAGALAVPCPVLGPCHPETHLGGIIVRSVSQ